MKLRFSHRERITLSTFNLTSTTPVDSRHLNRRRLRFRKSDLAVLCQSLLNIGLPANLDTPRLEIMRSSAPGPVRTAVLLPITVLIAAMLVSSCTSKPSDTSNGSNSRVVATVDGAPIVVPELRHFMSLNRSAVYNHFYRTHDATHHDDFWTTEFGGTTPLAELKRRSLQDAIRYKVQHKIAREVGVSTIRHYDSLMAKRVQVNSRRARRANRGEPVYGPVQLTPRAYFSREREDMVLVTKKTLSQTDFKVSTARLKTLYANYRDSIITVRNRKGMTPPLRSFDAFAAVHQRNYTSEKYKERVDRLVSSAEITVDSTVFKSVRLDEK